ncbi:MAG: sensor histidine kinase [Oscillospiraceae bacterium]|nr:sensor histidine kinase [Oscillospiraceae bacterium]MCI1991365.1 sensor histidine kinase [Oscillospiraceae bacterium]MCI2034666.1 sensor histidine kinase [Oscillospiraceae bacterium]
MRHWSLGKRLNFMSVLMIVPLAILVVYLLFSLMEFCNAYSQMVRNIDEANTYSGYLKRDIDYVMYREVIGSKTYRQIYSMPEDKRPAGWEQLKNPYPLIADARGTFQSMAGHTEGAANAGNIRWILHCLDRLKIVVGEIDANIENGGTYDDSIDKLQLGVYILTADIQTQIQNYVYREALNFQEVQNGLTTQGQTAVRISIVLLIGIVLLNLLVSRSITKSVADPIRKLCRATERVAKGDFTETTTVRATDEVEILAESFNNMQSEIGRLIENIKEEQNRRRVMELQLLQEQINPHFLYNTLDAIVWLAEGGQDEQVVAMVASLSKFFRSMLSEGRDFITIDEETRHISSYLEIQKIRYRDILDYEIRVDEELSQYRILKLTLQPLVENALYHGIKNKRRGGKITVDGHRRGNEVVFTVSDDGVGMTEREQDELRKAVKRENGTSRRGFGLANVDERLRLHYGESYGLSFTSAPGKGTAFIVRIPLRKKA